MNYDVKGLKKHLVDSSNIEWIAYKEENKELYVGFRSGSTYVYFDVPKDIFDGILGAGSKGRYFWMKIRDKFKYDKVN